MFQSRHTWFREINFVCIDLSRKFTRTCLQQHDTSLIDAQSKQSNMTLVYIIVIFLLHLFMWDCPFKRKERGRSANFFAMVSRKLWCGIWRQLLRQRKCRDTDNGSDDDLSKFWIMHDLLIFQRCAYLSISCVSRKFRRRWVLRRERSSIWEQLPRRYRDFPHRDFPLAFPRGYFEIDRNASSRTPGVEMISDQRRRCRRENSYRPLEGKWTNPLPAEAAYRL